MSKPAFQPPRCKTYPNCPCGWFGRVGINCDLQVARTIEEAEAYKRRAIGIEQPEDVFFLGWQGVVR